MHQGEPLTVAKLHWLLGKATASLGAVRLADLSPKEIYAWRQTIPEGHRFDATQALRQVLRRAVEWEWLSDNPAKRVPNPQRRAKEKRPFESWDEIEAVAAQLKPVYGATVVFAAATGLRPSELFGLEWRDLDGDAGVVSNRRPPPYHGASAATGRNPRQRFSLVGAVFGGVPFATGCRRLRPLGSNKGSILSYRHWQQSAGVASRWHEPASRAVSAPWRGAVRAPGGRRRGGQP
jgi:integrase